ncbi:MAG: succinylglutamate desuccinylase/aspartoacylase family protein [Patescibacteria group bacterium]|nr:succinylglutamate desuccinylase/aspartoacylase family protein [Patescibacteria group bacterium]
MSTVPSVYQKKALRRFARRTVNGIPGVIHVRSPIVGPTVGITVCTHGNEPAGLAAISYLLDEVDIAHTLSCGDVYLVINNLAAAKQFTRFVDIDMNRLPSDMAVSRQADSEVVRAKQLLPIWRKFDIGLDIHSTTAKAPPMLVVVGSHLHHDLVKGFPISTVITNIDQVQRGKPASAYYGRGNARVFGIEAGQHKSESAAICAKRCVIALLQNLGMLAGKSGKSRQYAEYKVVQGVILPNESYETPADGFPNFGSIKKGTLIARGNGPDIVMPFDGHTIMHNSKKRPTDPLNETLFITEPVRQY